MKRILNIKPIFYIGILFFSAYSTAYAQDNWFSFFNQIGWPMILLILPGFLLLLIPISLIKSFVFKHYFPQKSFKKIFWPVILASLYSTLIGIPLVWSFFLLLKVLSKLLLIHEQAKALPSNLLLNTSIESQLLLPIQTILPYIQWLISISLIFLLIPFYFISSWLEGKFLTKFKTFPNTSLIKKISRKANLASYLFLFLLGFIIILWLYFIERKIHINI